MAERVWMTGPVAGSTLIEGSERRMTGDEGSLAAEERLEGGLGEEAATAAAAVRPRLAVRVHREARSKSYPQICVFLRPKVTQM